jgi:hypothetical protein
MVRVPLHWLVVLALRSHFDFGSTHQEPIPESRQAGVYSARF